MITVFATTIRVAGMKSQGNYVSHGGGESAKLKTLNYTNVVKIQIDQKFTYDSFPLAQIKFKLVIKNIFYCSVCWQESW